MEKINKAAEVFKKLKNEKMLEKVENLVLDIKNIKEQIKHLEHKFITSNNEYFEIDLDSNKIINNLKKDIYEIYENIINQLNNTLKSKEERISTIEEKLNNLLESRINQFDLKAGNHYFEIIEEIKGIEKCTYRDMPFNNYHFTLKGIEGVFTSFISSKYNLESNFKITFQFMGTNKLKDLRILDI